MITLIASFTGQTWGSPGADRTMLVTMLVTCILVSGYLFSMTVISLLNVNAVVVRHTVRCRYHTVNFLPNLYGRHSIARPVCISVILCQLERANTTSIEYNSAKYLAWKVIGQEKYLEKLGQWIKHECSQQITSFPLYQNYTLAII